MRFALAAVLLTACSSSPSAPPMGMPGYPPAPGYPAPVPPGVPGMPGYGAQLPPGVPAQPGWGSPAQPGWGAPGSPQAGIAPVPGVVPVGPVGAPTLTPAVAPTAIPPGFRQISGPGFVFAVPAAWIDIPPPLPQVVVAARATTQTGSLFANANLVTEPFPGDGQTYAAANVAGLGSAAMILSQNPRSVGGRVGADIEARWTNAMPPYRTLQRLTAASGTGYVLTCTADDAAFEQARATCNAVLESFRVLP